MGPSINCRLGLRAWINHRWWSMVQWRGSSKMGHWLVRILTPGPNPPSDGPKLMDHSVVGCILTAEPTLWRRLNGEGCQYVRVGLEWLKSFVKLAYRQYTVAYCSAKFSPIYFLLLLRKQTKKTKMKWATLLS